VSGAPFFLFYSAICAFGLRLRLYLIRVSKQSGGKSSPNANSLATGLVLEAVVRADDAVPRRRDETFVCCDAASATVPAAALAPSSSTRADSESGPLLSLRATEIFAFKRWRAKAWAAFAAPMIHDLSVL
jgi:hypothetical protein